MHYIYLRQNPTDENISNAIKLEIFEHRKRVLKSIKNEDTYRVELWKFFKETCEETRKENRPSFSQVKFLKKIGNEIWETIPELQAMINPKKFYAEKTKKTTARVKKREDKRLGKIKSSEPVAFQATLF